MEPVLLEHTLRFDGHNYILDGKVLKLEPSLSVRRHSPTGFGHGYSGSGPAQLAVAIMLEINGRPDGYQEFKERVIAPLPFGKTFEIDFELDR